MSIQVVSTVLDRQLRFGGDEFGYFVRPGNAWPELLERLDSLHADHYVLITDSAFPRRLAEQARTQIATLAGGCTLLTFPAGEGAKSVETYAALSVEAEQQARITTASCIVALGGGLVGNLAGFLSATQFRGIKLVQLPTTLLSMADVMPSLKQAINTLAGKNHLGAYYAPQFVWNDLSYLSSLPAIEVQSALSEMIKFIVTVPPQDQGVYDAAVRMLRPDLVEHPYAEAEYLHFLQLCVDAKSDILRRDPHESGEGLIFEFGHTAGHALELLSYQPGNRPITHGGAVALGMRVAVQVSARMGLLENPNLEAYLLTLLSRNGVQVTIPAELGTDEILHLMLFDNKRGRLLPLPKDMLNMVLLRDIQRVNRTSGTVLTQVALEHVRAAIEACRVI